MTGCPHSMRSGPCSSCMSAAPRLVTIENGVTLVDGVPVESPGAYGMPQPRGQAHRYGRRRK